MSDKALPPIRAVSRRASPDERFEPRPAEANEQPSRLPMILVLLLAILLGAAVGTAASYTLRLVNF